MNDVRKIKELLRSGELDRLSEVMMLKERLLTNFVIFFFSFQTQKAQSLEMVVFKFILRDFRKLLFWK